MKINKNTLIRDLTPSDRAEFIRLKLKQGDVTEIYNMLNVDIESYLEWHFDTHMDITRGIYYRGKLFGFLCITDDSNLCFLTTDMDRATRFSMVRSFNKVLDAEMIHRGKDNVNVVIDSTYVTALKWAKHGGFIFKDFIKDTVHPLEVLTYWRQIDVN